MAYLRSAEGRRDLTVLTHALARRVLLERGHAVGLEFTHAGALRRVRARREVLLAAGAIGSPQLLMLSGIGDPVGLEAAGVSVQVALRGVGRKLQDHLDFCTLQKCTRPVTYGFRWWQEAMVARRYALTRSGPGASNVAEAGGFMRSRLAPDTRADLQFHFVPAQLDDHRRNRLAGHGYTMHVFLLRPESRGSPPTTSPKVRT